MLIYFTHHNKPPPSPNPPPKPGPIGIYPTDEFAQLYKPPTPTFSNLHRSWHHKHNVSSMDSQASEHRVDVIVAKRRKRRRDDSPERSGSRKFLADSSSLAPRNSQKKKRKKRERKDSTEEEYYLVKEIVSEKRDEKGRVLYLIDWEDNPETEEVYDQTWVRCSIIQRARHG